MQVLESKTETLLEDGKVYANNEQVYELQKMLYAKEILPCYHYVIIRINEDKFLFELDPEAMEEYYDTRGE